MCKQLLRNNQVDMAISLDHMITPSDRKDLAKI